ncbi:MAG: FtsQ-type POTRA domain-containing protein [Pseudoflavonifractor sp.]|nr:FtsQ-type POTRA domain-containing protein [Pseudoflavonifractor sp.]MDY3020074.1 FtsQ-type POTRA domain-containing protein [Oscillospiraceae bacterium]
MAARKKRNRHRRRRGRFGFLYPLLSFLIIFAAILAGSVAFFRVNQVTVVGNSRYTAEEVAEASGVQIGDNLCLINKPKTAQSILRRLPYVEKVSPVRRLPDTLELRITETSAVAAVQAEESWWLLDADGKLLEQGDASLRGSLPQVLGLTPIAPSLGSRVAVDQETEEAPLKVESLRALLSALAERGMSGNLTEFIDLTASNVIYFGYGEGLTVAVPMTGDFDKRVFSLQRVMETFAQRGEAVTGTLDLTYGDEQARLLTSRWTPAEQTGNEQEGGGTDGASQPEAGTDTGDAGAAESPAA